MTGTAQRPPAPLRVRLHFGRAAVQTVADRSGIDVLHLKGDAVDSSLRAPQISGTDVDIMVRPSQAAALDAAIRAHGWELYSTFENGSPFAHAQTYHHAEWGYLDLHCRFPGIGLDDESAFALLWNDRGTMAFCDVPCAVPSVPAQAVILMLNAARAGDIDGDDVRRAWLDASEESRRRVSHQVDALDARLAFDAARGLLDRHRHERGYRLWKVVSTGGGRLEEWWGRLRFAPTPRAKGRVVVHAVLVNVDHLRHRLGRKPTRADIVREFFARPVRGIRELRPGASRRQR